MFRSSATSLAVVLPAVLLSSAAWADLTPAQVWGDWRQYMEGAGYGITASETEADGVLTVSDIAIAIPSSQNGGETTMTVGTLRFEAADNGAVAVVMPETLTIGVSSRSDADAYDMEFSYSQTGHSMLVSGTPGDMSYDYAAATAGLKLNRLSVDGKEVSPEDARVDVQATNFTSQTSMKIGDLRSYEQTGQIEGIIYDLVLYNPDEAGRLGIRGSLDGLTLDGSGTIPLSVENSNDMSAMIAAGFDATGEIAYEKGMTELDIKQSEESDGTIVTSSSGGSLGVGMGADGLAYEGRQTGTKVTMQLADLPFPIDFSMARSGFNLAIPVSAGEEPQNFALGLNLEEFVMSDMVWGIFDPTGQLPRDAATIQLDLAGAATLQTDVLDANATAQLDGPPGEIESVTLDRLVIDAAGARLEGTGQATFDNADTTSFPGMPKPVGKIDLMLAGGNALIDKLTAMGLLPDEQAMGARMMMGLFAVPGDEPDTLKSTIEFTEDGQVLANGQRIR